MKKPCKSAGQSMYWLCWGVVNGKLVLMSATGFFCQGRAGGMPVCAIMNAALERQSVEYDDKIRQTVE